MSMQWEYNHQYGIHSLFGNHPHSWESIMAHMKVKGLVYKKCAVDRVPSPSYVKTCLYFL